MRVLAIESSSRNEGNTYQHVDALLKVQKEDIEYEIIKLHELSLPLFIDNRQTVQWDIIDKLEVLYKKMRESDVIILASPLYWFNLSNHLKNFLDHWSYLLRHPKYPLKENLVNKKFVSVIVGSRLDEDEKYGPALKSIELSLNYLGLRPNLEFMGAGDREGVVDKRSIEEIKKINLLNLL